MSKWINGNSLSLLENGEAFFPRVFECIAAAEHEVVLETFILFEDTVGKQLHAALLKAAARGARVDITVDGFGSPDLSNEFISTLTEAGVRVHIFDPGTRVLGWRTNVFRRMHRKIIVVDGNRVFMGGINFSADHLAAYGPQAKQDYSVEITGPIVSVIHDFVLKALAAGQRNAKTTLWSRLRDRFSKSVLARARRRDLVAPDNIAGEGAAIFVTRDNRKHTTDIERHYRIAIRAARHRLVIANAYFFPGYRLLKELRKASRRGVDVRLILQGEPDMPIVKIAASMLYHNLINAGVKIYEYCERPLHGKVAVSDDLWATVGSSNLDPLSLSLNLESNVVIKDHAFNQRLSDRLDHLMTHACKLIDASQLAGPSYWLSLRSFFIYHMVRLYPSLCGLLPAHAPHILPALASVAPASNTSKNARSAGADKVSRADVA